MNVSIKAAKVRGSLQIPASKSHTQRVYAAALLHNGLTRIGGFGDSNDECAALQIIRNLGARVQLLGRVLHIRSEGLPFSGTTIHCGESGLAARLFIPILGLSGHPVLVNAEGSLLNRPMGASFLDTLSSLGIVFHPAANYLPFSVNGPLNIRDICVDAGNSSQWISGLLFALAYAAKRPVLLEVKNLVSRPYIDLSLEVLKRFGRPIIQQGNRFFHICPDTFTDKEEIDVQIEADWSSAAFWIVAATLSGSMALSGLNPASVQADKYLLDVLSGVGAVFSWKEDGCLWVDTASDLSPVDADLSDTPDLFPVLSVLAACIPGVSCLKGTRRLVHKESDRLQSIIALLQLLEVPFSLSEDTLRIEGVEKFPAFVYESPNDHRMAMAAALAALRGGKTIEIRNAECVRKSYPLFWEHVQKHFCAG